MVIRGFLRDTERESINVGAIKIDIKENDFRRLENIIKSEIGTKTIKSTLNEP